MSDRDQLPSTTKDGSALLLGSGRQLELVDLDEIGLPPEAYESEEARGRWTGERLFSQRPMVYRACAKLLARGDMGYREIADLLEISTNTVCGVAYREGITIETIRERLGRKFMDLATLSVETALELLNDPVRRRTLSAKDLGILAGIATERGQLLLGGATQRIDHGDMTPPDHAAYLDAIKNVTPTGSPAGNPAPNAAIDIESMPTLPPPSTPSENAQERLGTES